MKKAIVVSKLNNTQALTALLKEEGFGSVVSAETSEIATDTREESEAETESETGEKKHYENLGKDLEK